MTTTRTGGLGRRDILTAAAAIPLLALDGVPAAAATASRGTGANPGLADFERRVRATMTAEAIPGMTAGFARGAMQWVRGYGYADLENKVPVTAISAYRYASVQKPMTAVAVLQLVERGKLSFEDPLSKFLPDFPDKASAEKIKIKHLLSHTAGLGSYFNRKFQESSRELYRTVDEMLKLAQDEKMAFEPGTRWQYSNTGMLVLGKVIEKASGQDFFEYIRENIYKPAGMINSDCYELDHVNQNLAIGYDKEYGDKGYTFENNIFKHVMRGGPAGGGYSTVEDLHRFAVALRAGKLVGAEYVKLLLSAKPELNSPNYGYGFQISASPLIAGHGGGFPGISSNLDMYLDNGYIAIVMSNYGRASGLASDKMRELVMSGQETKVADR